jgi:hypothetical protein
LIDSALRTVGIIVCGMLLMAATAIGCGDDTDTGEVVEKAATTVADVATATTDTRATTATEPDCDFEAGSIIPEPSGSSQHVYFYRDT